MVTPEPEILFALQCGGRRRGAAPRREVSLLLLRPPGEIPSVTTQSLSLLPEPVLLKLLLAINLALAAVLYSSDYQIAVLESSVLSVGRQSDCCLTAAPVAGTVNAKSSDTTELL